MRNKYRNRRFIYKKRQRKKNFVFHWKKATKATVEPLYVYFHFSILKFIILNALKQKTAKRLSIDLYFIESSEWYLLSYYHSNEKWTLLHTVHLICEIHIKMFSAGKKQAFLLPRRYFFLLYFHFFHIYLELKSEWIITNSLCLMFLIIMFIKSLFFLTRR